MGERGMDADPAARIAVDARYFAVKNHRLLQGKRSLWMVVVR
jgi:hypothetical protein